MAAGVCNQKGTVVATYIVTPIEGDESGRQPGAKRFKTRWEAQEHFDSERDQGRFVIMYKEDYDRSGEVMRANDRN